MDTKSKRLSKEIRVYFVLLALYALGEYLSVKLGVMPKLSKRDFLLLNCLCIFLMSGYDGSCLGIVYAPFTLFVFAAVSAGSVSACRENVIASLVSFPLLFILCSRAVINSVELNRILRSRHNDRLSQPLFTIIISMLSAISAAAVYFTGR